MGPCMCGDTCCPSCGPAQGNYKCPACGNWESDGGCANPEACQKKSAEMDDALAAEYQWQEDHADEIAAAIRQE